MTHLDEQQTYSTRYGLESAYRHNVPTWQCRHDISYQQPRDKNSCICPGIQTLPFGVSTCHLQITQEDMLCNECRQWCTYLSINDRRIHRIVELLGKKEFNIS
jgi:hypothetical protein